MNESKEEIRYTLKFYFTKEKKKRRMRFRLLKKCVMFMDVIQYQYVWHKAGSSVFSLGILILKMVDQLLEKSMKS